MANKRMFAKTIVDSDNFLDMPMSARLLYYDLGMRADDDGFVDSPKKIMKTIGASNGDMKILIERKFVIPFESGIVVIRHWRINNYLRSDRYAETMHLHEKALLDIDDNNQYIMHGECASGGIPHGIPVVDADKNSIDKINNICAKAHQKEVDDLFESLWKLYIRKKGKSQVSKKSKEKIFDIGYDRMKKCIDKYASEKVGCDEQYILMGSTFFNGRFEDYLEPEENPIQEEPKQEEHHLDAVIDLEDDGSNYDEWNKDRKEHSFADGWRINDDGYWINEKLGIV